MGLGHRDHPKRGRETGRIFLFVDHPPRHGRVGRAWVSKRQCLAFGFRGRGRPCGRRENAGLGGTPGPVRYLRGRGEVRAGLPSVLTSGDCANGGVEGARHRDALAPFYAYTGSFVQTHQTEPGDRLNHSPADGGVTKLGRLVPGPWPAMGAP
jgi:hypothetical protein